jgi:hypothetical protein
MRKSRSYTTLVDGAAGPDPSTELGAVQEVAAPHQDPGSHPILIDQGRASQDTQANAPATEPVLRPATSSFDKAGGWQQGGVAAALL